jgi:hypothetical protein
MLTSATTSLFDTLANATIFLVFRVISVGTNPPYHSIISIPNKLHTYLTGLTNSAGFVGSNAWTWSGDFTANSNTTVPQDVNQQMVYSLASGAQQIYINGTVGGAQTRSFSVTTGTSLTLTIGSITTTSYNDGFNGNLSEVLFFSNALTAAQRQRVEGYLANKWGLRTSLGTPHPFKYSPPSFLPTQLSNCALWLDGADVNGTGTPPASGTAVATWVDKSGNSKNLTQGTTSNQPATALVNGLRFVNFTASNTTFLSNTSMTIDYRTSQIFLVFQRKAAGGNNGVFSALTTTNSGGDWTNTNEFIITSFTEVASAGSGTNDNASGNVNLTAYQFNINNNNLTTFRDFGSSSVITRAMALSTSPNSLILGRRRDGATGLYPADIYFGEAIVYSRLLTTDESQRVQGYLAWKWGLQASLPTPSHPYATFKP